MRTSVHVQVTHFPSYRRCVLIMSMPRPNRTGFGPDATVRPDVARIAMTPWCAAGRRTDGRLARCRIGWDDRPGSRISAAGTGAGPRRIAAGPERVAAGPERVAAGPDRIAAGCDRIAAGPGFITARGDDSGSSSGAHRCGWITSRRARLRPANRGPRASYRLTHQSGTSPAGFIPENRRPDPPGIGRTPKGRQ